MEAKCRQGTAIVTRAINVISECLGMGAETYLVKPTDFQGFATAAQKMGMSWLLLDTPPKA